MKMYSLAQGEATKVYDSKWYESNIFTDEAKVAFQLFESRLCMPFDLFMSLTNKVFMEEMTTIAFGSREQINHLQERLVAKGTTSVDGVRRSVLQYCGI